jgi:hypothetical protein
MINLALNDGIFSTLTEIAASEHKTLEQLFDDWIEDYLDKKAAERADQTLARIRSGEEKTYTLEQVEKMLHEMDS